MSGATHTQTPIRQQLKRDERRAKIVALCIVTTFTALLITLILVLAGGDSPTTGSNESQDQAAQQAPDLRVGPYPSAASVPAELQRSTPGGVGR
jgi:hypothetical protein